MADLPVVRSRFGIVPDPGFTCSDDGRTHQEFAIDCDINRIMARAVKTGTVPGRTDVGRYGDFSEAVDYQAAQNVLVRAQGQFSALSAATRDRFNNDPVRFLEFVHSKETTLAQLNELGLLTDEARARVTAPKSLEVVPPA